LVIDPKETFTLISKEESKFVRTFNQLVYQRSQKDVGGFPINHLASPNGYCFQNHAYSHAWFPTRLGKEANKEIKEFEKTGTASFSYSVTSPHERGLGIIGVYLQQINLGYVYNPLIDDKPIQLNPITLEQINEHILNYTDLPKKSI